jgi:membrane protein
MNSRLSSVSSRIERFFDHDIWTDVSGARLWRRFGIRCLRVVVAALRASRDQPLNLHAMGLVYSTLLSLVPFLAVAISVLKAFGVQYRLEPVLARVLEPLGPQGVELADRVVEFVSRMNVGVLGAVGLAGLFYTALSLIGKIEDALNQIWQVRRSRALRRKFSDYLSVLLVGPVLVFAAFAILASVQNYSFVVRILRITGLHEVAVFVAGHVMPFLFLVFAFTFLYRFLPYTRVRLGAAVVGGVTAAMLWELVGIAFTALVASSASYTAIYSSFAVLIVCLIWLQVAWLVVLIGGQVAYAHQQPLSYAERLQRSGWPYRERIGLAALAEITRAYLGGEPAYRVDELAQVIGAPLSILEELTDAFVARGVLVRAAEPDGAVVLSRPPEDVKVIDVLEAIGDPAQVEGLTPPVAGNPVSEVLQRRDQALRAAVGEVTLRALVPERGRQEANVANLTQYRR